MDSIGTPGLMPSSYSPEQMPLMDNSMLATAMMGQMTNQLLPPEVSPELYSFKEASTPDPHVSPPMTDQEVVSFVKKFQTQSELSRDPIKKMWDAVWDMYNNQYDFSDKTKWQSQVVPPRAFMMVTRATATVKKALFAPTDWFTVATGNPWIQNKIDIVRRSAKYHLMHPDVQFPILFEEMFKGGLLANLLTAKVGWRDKEETTFDEFSGLPMVFYKGILDIKSVSPYNVLLDYTGRKSGIIEKAKMHYHDFLIWAKSNGFDTDEIKPTSTAADTENYEAYKRRQQQEPGGDLDKEIALMTYWGDIWSPQGQPAWTNVQCILASDKLLMKPTPNHYWHRQLPYAHTGLILDPFSVYHNSIMTSSYGMLEVVLQLLNLLVDSLTLASIHQYEIDYKGLYDTGQLEEGIYPGKIWARGSMLLPNQRLLQAVSSGEISPQTVTLYQLMDRELQLGSGITESMQGIPRMRGRTSAMEIAQTAAESNVLFDAIVDNLETKFLAKIIELTYLTILQFQSDYGDENFARAVFDNEAHVREFLDMSPEERYSILAGDFVFEVKSLSVMLQRREELEKIAFFLRMIGQIQPAVRSLKWTTVLRKVFEALNWDIEDLIDYQEFENYLKEQKLQTDMQMQQMAMQQQQMQQQQRGGQPQQGGSNAPTAAPRQAQQMPGAPGPANAQQFPIAPQAQQMLQQMGLV